MENKNIEQLAAQTILENGVRVNLPAPFFFRVLGKKEISVVIRQPKLGTLLHISNLSLKADFSFEGINAGDLDAAHLMIKDHTLTATKIIAVAILNSKLKIMLFKWILAKYMIWKLTPKSLTKTIIVLITLSGVQDFTTSIRLVRSMKVTTPTSQSPMDQGSQKVEQSA